MLTATPIAPSVGHECEAKSNLHLEGALETEANKGVVKYHPLDFLVVLEPGVLIVDQMAHQQKDHQH